MPSGIQLCVRVHLLSICARPKECTGVHAPLEVPHRHRCDLVAQAAHASSDEEHGWVGRSTSRSLFRNTECFRYSRAACGARRIESARLRAASLVLVGSLQKAHGLHGFLMAAKGGSLALSKMRSRLPRRGIWLQDRSVDRT